MRMIMAAALAATALSATLLAGCSEPEAVEEAPAYSASQYNSAIVDIARPAEDKARDEARKPGELLAFAEIDRGDAVGDFVMGGGYVTRLLAMSVGSEGNVYAFQPTEFIAFRPEYATEQDAAVEPFPDQVVALRAPMSEPGFPENLDTIITVNNLHDLFTSQLPEGTAEAAIAALFDALKPGGSLIVVDHVAQAGGGLEAAETLHRMDPELAMSALTAAGFVLETESDMYANPEDPHNANVFDPSIMGQTDQFSWRLRKPE